MEYPRDEKASPWGYWGGIHFSLEGKMQEEDEGEGEDDQEG